jgi:hypothetical protein
MRSQTEYAEIGDKDGDFIDHVADELAGWLGAVIDARGG